MYVCICMCIYIYIYIYICFTSSELWLVRSGYLLDERSPPTICFEPKSLLRGLAGINRASSSGLSLDYYYYHHYYDYIICNYIVIIIIIISSSSSSSSSSVIYIYIYIYKHAYDCLSCLRSRDPRRLRLAPWRNARRAILAPAMKGIT